ncbi:aromatic compounds catabolic protein (plasmid) [Cupriavidus necator N-1]|uniref:Aromatic compounds catabolic protein n=1 Tax=Cupriavidus necator (strain ATCC 43291 / DSM 13513 / CCUG 52238 / LMG 8453 / N-1) TaxID=1042878 RepID=F8GWB2_CUPNN|nr:PaaI family thioesterase [Cupriavidus necator]AEI81687.1 aromatic compounds catabolic protein [Cupriavidus necator N-1]MDX6008039.1 PaaI family thioesterase [Cupriavidus necator]
MENNQESLVWISQQSDAKQRIRKGGGAPGLARIDQVAGKSGLEILEAMMSGQLPYPPMNETMNMTLLEVDNGRAVFQGIPLRQHYNPLGTVHGGWFATLLDSALGCSVQTMLPARRSYTTAELSINIVRAASHKTGPLRGVATVVHSGRQIATAEARVEDAKGKLYAHATTTCFVFDVPAA